MHIRDKFENTRASLFHRSPLPILEVALTELISKETQQQTHRVHSTDMVLATTPSSSSTPATPAVAVASSKSRRFNSQCHYCKEDDHCISDCPKKKAKDTLKANASYSSKPVAAISTSSSASNSSFEPFLSSLSATDIEAIVTQVLSRTSTALLVSIVTHRKSLNLVLLIYTADGSHMSVSHFGHVSTPILSDLKTSQLVGTEHKVGCLFELTSLHLLSSSSPQSLSAAVSSSVWHSRLGHTSLSCVQSLASSGYI
ncbi:uncharacterized protein LOC111381931, partial [Olea europaea var. sylvestris]|uniref:uncharacterized protein LOC111381931 n=1 Tax=Olea europaea var. sylvestris TaxID=158386 RepID=UPI000C1D60D2